VKKGTISAITLAAVGASLLWVLVSAGSATAKRKCILMPTTKRAPHLISPCNGATVKRGGDIVFKAYDSNSKAGQYHPYLNLQTRRRLSHGHLTPNRNGNGIFNQLTRVKGHRDEWTLSSKDQIYPTWWDNHRGTYYVQVQQIDARARGGVFYSPIVTIHVG
jgi:hypothetical protein